MSALLELPARLVVGQAFDELRPMKQLLHYWSSEHDWWDVWLVVGQAFDEFRPMKQLLHYWSSEHDWWDVWLVVGQVVDEF